MARSHKNSKLSALAKKMRGIDLCMMTTYGERGSLHTRPMSNNGEVDFDGVAYFFTNVDTAKVREIRRNPQVALSYVGGTKSRPIWISVSGTARVVRSAARKRELWVTELKQWFDGGPEDRSIVVLEVQARRASWWSYDDEGAFEFPRRRAT